MVKIKNYYKNTSIFRCSHEIHSGFSGKMSVYHILKTRKCYPEGCIYFKWKCKQLNKRHKCEKGFSHVGKQCFNCPYFYEEKIQLQPKLMVSKEEYKMFQKNLEDFEEWVYFHQNKSLEIHGKIDNVKPHYKKIVNEKNEKIIFIGYILSFKKLYIGNDLLDDFTFVLISSHAQERYQFVAGDILSAKARLKILDGRLVFSHVHHVELDQRGEGELWTLSKSLVANQSYSSFPIQPEGCIQCPYGALIDVENHSKRNMSGRELICLKGIQDYRLCHVKAEFCYMNSKKL